MKLRYVVPFAFYLAFAGKPVPAQTLSPTRLINVSGTGEVQVQPDEAQLIVGVEVRDPNLELVHKKTDQEMKALIKALQKAGIDPKDMQTTHLSLSPEYQEQDTKPNPTLVYTGRKELTITVHNLATLEEVLVNISKTGVNRLSGLVFKNSKLTDHKTTARKRAIADARSTAATLAEEAGVRLGPVQTITESNPFEYQPMAYKTEAAMSADNASIEPGMITVRVAVEVSFAIE